MVFHGMVSFNKTDYFTPTWPATVAELWGNF